MTGSWKVLLLIVTFLTGFSGEVLAQKRVALVVGNNAYSRSPLDNPRNDARLIADRFRSQGFEITGGGPIYDASSSRFEAAFNQFVLDSDNAEIALLYFSGHGSASGNANYLAMTDDRSVDTSVIVRRLSFSRPKLRVILLDACRSERAGGTGFLPIQAPENTLIGFATQPGDTATQGPANSVSPYAAAIAEALGSPGADVFTFFNEVGLKVMNKTSGSGKIQKPWINASPIRGTFYLSRPMIANASQSTSVATSTDVVPREQQIPAARMQSQSTVVSSGEANSYIQDAWVRLSKADYATARAILEEGIKHDPSSAFAYSYMGYAWFEEGNILRRAIVERKDLDMAERSRRLKALIGSHYAPAFAALDTAINLNGSYSSFYRHRGNAVIGVYHTRRQTGQSTSGTMDRAIRDLERAVQADPTSMRAANDLGTGYFLADRFDDAMESYNNALRINPKYLDPRDGLCRVYMRLGRFAEAQAEANIAARASEFEKKQCLRTKVAGAQ